MDIKPRLLIKTAASKTTLLDRTLSRSATPIESYQVDSVGSPFSDNVSVQSSTPTPRHSLTARSTQTFPSSRSDMSYNERVPVMHRIPQTSKSGMIETGVGIGIRGAGIGAMLEGVESSK